MKVPANWEHLIELCAAQDRGLRKRSHAGQSWYEIISENLDGYGGGPVTRRWVDVYAQEQRQAAAAERKGALRLHLLWSALV